MALDRVPPSLIVARLAAVDCQDNGECCGGDCFSGRCRSSDGAPDGGARRREGQRCATSADCGDRSLNFGSMRL